LCAAVAFFGTMGCARNRAETITMTPPQLSLHRRVPVSPFLVTAHDGHGRDLYAPVVRWASGDTAILAVDQTGMVTPRRSGTATVTATSGHAAATASILVAMPAAIVFPESSVTIRVGEHRRLRAEIRDENGHPVPGKIHWETGDKRILYVSPDGVVEASSTGRASALASVDAIDARLPLVIVEPERRQRGRTRRSDGATGGVETGPDFPEGTEASGAVEQRRSFSRDVRRPGSPRQPR
jgi:hypothetical protein